MSKNVKRYPKYIPAAVAVLLLVAVAAVLFFVLSAPEARKEDFERISMEEYDTAFLSMFPIGNYDEEDYAYYRAQHILKTAYCIPDIRTLKSYMKELANSGNTVSTVYLGVRPEDMPADKLLALLQEYPSVNYHVILAYPSMDYWASLSDRELQNHLQKYRELTDTLLSESNVSVYHFAKEWLICNPANYEDSFLTTEEISHTLMVNCDRDHGYVLTSGNVDAVFSEFSQLLEQNRTAPTVYPDLSDYRIVFFGDSIIANYTDSSSVPGAVNGLTGASVYNCGYGGNSASWDPEFPVTLPGIVEAFINEDLSPLPQDKQVYEGMKEYFADTSDATKLCFVINYGLNDYFIGAPVTAEDPYDINSYSGALRTAVTSLQEAYPDAQILLTTPNFTSYFSNGEERNSEVGGTLAEYAEAVRAIGTECNVSVLDNFAELGINAENHGIYLIDGCHPNEATRFTMGSRIALAVE